MNTAEPNAADATTTEDYDSRWRGQRCSLSQRERAGVREAAANRWRLATRRALPLHELERRPPARLVTSPTAATRRAGGRRSARVAGSEIHSAKMRQCNTDENQTAPPTE